jgi:hypothetical protein
MATVRNVMSDIFYSIISLKNNKMVLFKARVSDDILQTKQVGGINNTRFVQLQ